MRSVPSARFQHPDDLCQITVSGRPGLAADDAPHAVADGQHQP